MLGRLVSWVIGPPDVLLTTTRGSHFGSDTVAYMGYVHHTGYCMYYGFCGRDSDLSRSGTTENSCAREDLNLSRLLAIGMRIVFGVKTRVRTKTDWATVEL